MFELICLTMVVLNTFGGNYVLSAQDACTTSFQCGGLSISYPFWSLGDNHSPCGYHGLGVNCSTGKPILSVQGRSYWVKNINYSDKSLTAVVLDLTTTVPCAAASLKSLDGSEQVLLFDGRKPVLQFYRNCSLYPKSKLDVSCLDDAGTNRSYFLTQDSGYMNCEEIIRISVVSKVTNISNLSTYASVLQEGFQLTWSNSRGYEQCSPCENIGGRCRYNSPLGSDNQLANYALVCVCPRGRIAADDSDCFRDLCQPFQCGGLSINYPFWSIVESLGDMYYYCGYEGLGVNCSDGKPILTVGSQAYVVKSINYTDQTFTAVDLDFTKEPCATDINSRSVESKSVSRFESGEVLYFNRNCSSYPKSKLDVSCKDSTGTNRSYFVTQVLDFSYKCYEVISIPVVEQAAKVSNRSTYASVMQGGFPFVWYNTDDVQCRDCELSGGRCLFHPFDGHWSYWSCLCPNGNAAYGYCDGPYEGNHTFPASGNPPFAGPGAGNHTLVGAGNHTLVGAGNHTLGSASTVKKKIVIGVMSGLGSLVLIILLSLYTYRKKFSSLLGLICAWSDKKSTTNVEVFLENCGPPFLQRYTYSNLKKITNFFKDKLGQGGYGDVFKGKLKDGSFVAVKVLNESKGNGEEFTNEVTTIGRTNHINIVRLIGFCAERSKRALVYEYMPNGSLEKFIYNKKSPTTPHPLGQEKLYQIALGIANGLEYLHRGCNTRILHFDIKPHNILLDTDFCPKISDFGLAKLCPTRESVISMLNIRGTQGYIAPEVISKNFGGVSPKSDVYSYGMMVLEMVGGRKNIDPTVDNISEIYFPRWIYNHLEKQEMNGLGEINEGFEEENIKKMIIVGLWCIQNQPAIRPSMSMVVEMLQKSVDDLQMPPNPFVDLPTSS